MAEWHEAYREASGPEVLIQALEACSRRDCAHCLYQGCGVRCRQRLMLDAAQALSKKMPRQVDQT